MTIPILLALLYAVMVALKPLRRLALAMTPWFLFGTIYSLLGLWPNYRVNPVDVAGLYGAEKHLFGIAAGHADMLAAASACPGTATDILTGGLLIPGEYFAVHHAAWADFLAGLFYLSWVPVPLIFAFAMFFTGHAKWTRRFSWCWLCVNLLGFVGYYIHPAAPPWYAMHYGFDVITGTPGDTAALARFDAMTHLGIFHALYGQNSNVFAAVPSLHAAYPIITLTYAILSKRSWWVCALLAVLCPGIWCTAIYTGHHYTIDVLLGIATAIVGITLFEAVRQAIKRKHPTPTSQS